MQLNNFTKRMIEIRFAKENLKVIDTVSFSYGSIDNSVFCIKLQHKYGPVYFCENVFKKADEVVIDTLVKKAVEFYSSIAIADTSQTELANFIERQLILKLDFDKKISHTFGLASLVSFIKDILPNYSGARDFICDLDNIELKKLESLVVKS